MQQGRTASSARESRPEHENASEISLLVIEDSATDLELLRLALERDQRTRFTLQSADRLAAGLERIENNDFDLVVCDLDLPDSAGIETFRRLRAAAPELPVVVLTGGEDPTLGMKLVHEGAQDYLVKGELGAQMPRCLAYAVERHQQQRELLEARADAERSSQAKSHFLAAMSHEIRTPMNAILGMAELLHETELGPEQTGYVEVFRRAGEGLLELINGLLDFSRVEAGQLTLERVEFPLWELLEGAGELMAFPAHKKGLVMALDLAPALPARVVGDPSRLRQILLNLLGNAIKFTDHGHVILRAALGAPQDGASIQLQVSTEDTGVGIPPEKLDAVFNSFEQADSATARCYGGSGLGLSLSRHLAELMRGRLWAESKEREGSRFHLEIPLELPADHQNSDAQNDTALPGKRVLLAEPNAVEREILRRQLERWGLEVWSVADGHEAVRFLDSHKADAPVDLLMLACRMPGRGGLTILQECDQLKGAASSTILLMPADRRPGDLDACRELGIGSWLEKPVKPSMLRRRVEDVILGESSVPERTHQRNAELGAMKVLVADDSLDNRSLIQAYLRSAPVELVLVSNGREAVDRFQGEKFDVVLMDIQMPVMNGYEATLAIRKFEQEQGLPRTPIFALTAFAFEEERRRIFDAGCDLHLVKPIRKADLLAQLAPYASDGSALIRIETDPDVADLVPGYLENRRSEVAELRTAHAEGDFELLRTRGHNLKGTGRGYGFDRITEIGLALEEAAKAGDLQLAGGQIDALADFLRRVEPVAYDTADTQEDKETS